MNIRDYLKIIGEKIAEAGTKGDKVEAVRLMHLAIDTLQEQINKLSK